MKKSRWPIGTGIFCALLATLVANGSPGGALWGVGRGYNGSFGTGGLPVHPVPVKLGDDVAAVAGGFQHTLFVKNDGTLWAAGDNQFGQAGLGPSRTSSDTAEMIATNTMAVAAGYFHSLYLKRDRTLWALGSNASGGLGDGTTTSRFRPVQMALDVASMAAGFGHSLFIKTDGTLWATGDNSHGQLGNGSTVASSLPVQIASNVRAVAAGAYHSLFLKTDGSLWAMGDNEGGQLGNGSTQDARTPVQVASGVTSVAAGAYFSLFVKTDGTLWAMGDNFDGQLTNGSATGSVTPIQMASGVVAAAAGAYHTLFLKTDGSAWSAGGNDSSQLGDNWPAPQRGTAVQVASAVAAVFAGAHHSLFLKNDGVLLGVGNNEAGQLGTGPSLHTTALHMADDIVAVSAGTHHTIFIKSDGTLWATGYNDFGQLGDGTTRDRVAPVLVAAGVVAACAKGGYHTLFVKTDGSLWATGSNIHGQLGDGTQTDRSTPIQVATEVVAVDTSFSSTLFLKRDGTLWGMGSNEFGELQYPGPARIVTPVLLASGVATMAAGNGFTLYVTTDGTLWGRGDNGLGRLGRGRVGEIFRSFETIATGVASVTCGNDHSLFVKSNGTLWGMGSNRSGQLGLVYAIAGTSGPIRQGDQLSPTQIATGVVAASAGNVHSTFLRSDGSGWAMGNNADGQIGDGTTSERDQPIQIASGIDRLVAGAASTYFIQHESPKITNEPHGGVLAFGDTVTLTVAASGPLPLSYQWFLNGAALPDANAPSYTTRSPGSYTVIVGGTAMSAAAALSLPSRLVNLSARARVGVDGNLLIAGWVVSGPPGATKQLLVRGVGPGLKPFGVEHILEQPTISVNGSIIPVMSNPDGTADGPRPDGISEALGAFPLPAGSADRVLLTTVDRGASTLHLSGAGRTEGVALAEIYEVDDLDPCQMINLSARGRAGVGEDVLIAGFVVSGTQPAKLLVRGVGPTLAGVGVPEALSNPQIRLYHGAEIVMANDDWGSATANPALADTMTQVGAFPLPDGSKDAAFLIQVEPGAYSVHVTGVGGTTGVALLEIYLVP